MRAIVVDGLKDKDGRTSFTMFWWGNRGFRAQCFMAVLSDYVDDGAVVFKTDEEARTAVLKAHASEKDEERRSRVHSSATPSYSGRNHEDEEGTQGEL